MHDLVGTLDPAAADWRQQQVKRCPKCEPNQARPKPTRAVFSGSASSGGAGVRAVLTAQNWQPRVHVSPAPRASSCHSAQRLPTCLTIPTMTRPPQPRGQLVRVNCPDAKQVGTTLHC